MGDESSKDINATLSNAVAFLQDAQTTLVKATDDLLTHNTALDSHQDIRAMIDAILHSETMYTRDQIVEIIDEKLSDHIAAEMAVAHPAIESAVNALETALAAATSRISSIEAWRDGTSDPNRTDLQNLIQAVYDKYAPMLESLQLSFKEADEAGNTEIADAIKANIQTTMDKQTAEVMDVINQWQRDNTPAEV